MDWGYSNVDHVWPHSRYNLSDQWLCVGVGGVPMDPTLVCSCFLHLLFDQYFCSNLHTYLVTITPLILSNDRLMDGLGLAMVTHSKLKP